MESQLILIQGQPSLSLSDKVFVYYTILHDQRHLNCRNWRLGEFAPKQC